MFATRRSAFEVLEARRALAVTAAVTDGDLIITGDADGAVEVVAIGDGSYQVTDNGTLIADETTLTGVTDDIRIDIDDTAGADNSVVVDLSAQTTQSVDRIYADLGNGANTLQLVGGTVTSLDFRGGSGGDAVDIGTEVTGLASVRLGAGENSLAVNAELGHLHVKGGSDADAVTIAAAVNGHVHANLGGGDNTFVLDSTVAGHLLVHTGSGLDTVTLTEASSVDRNVMLWLGAGDNSATLAGAIGGSLKYSGLDGNDILTTEATADIADNLFARLGAGDNSVTHNGSVGGDFRVTSANENDVVTIAETAVIGGEQSITLGQQGGNGRGHCGGNEGVALEFRGASDAFANFVAAFSRGRRR
jgi:hypothetical protein